MANIDFPPGAINGTTHTQNGKTWIYDGTSWSLVASLIPDASTTVSGLVNTSIQSFSGDKKFTSNLDIVGGLGVTGQSVFRNNVAIQSGGLGVTGQSVFRNNIEIQSGGLGITGGVTITGSGLTVISGGIGITGQSVFRNNVEIQSGGLGVTGGIGVTGGVTINGSGLAVMAGGLGVTGSSIFRNNVTIQSGGLGVTGGIGVTGGVTITGSGLAVMAGGIGITGQSVFRNNVEIQSGGLGVTGTISSDAITIRTGGIGITGQSVFRNNVEIQSGGIGVTGGVTITGSGLTIISGGIGVTGQSVFRNNIEIQSGGLGVTGGIGVTGRLTIHAGGLGVTGAAVFNSSISAGSLSLSTPLPLSSGGTGLGSTSLANYILGMNSSSLGLEYKQIVEGSNITITHNTNSITIAASSSSATPGGPNNAIQYNGSNTLAGTSAFLWDNSSQRIDIKNTNAIGTGTTTGFLLQNSTASTVSVQMQFSPGIEFVGRAWKTSGSPATDTLVRYLEMVEVTSGGTPTGAITWKSAIHNASNQGPTYVKRAEISTNYGLGIYETTGVYKSSIINSASATTDIYYTLPAALPSLNQSLAVTGISVSSVTLSWISSGTVASGASGALAYYAGAGTTVDDATGLAYASSGTHLVITSQTATDVPLRVDGHASSSVNLFQVRKGTNDQLVVNSSGNVSISSTQASTGASTGALAVAGGVGIGQTLYVGGNLYQGSNAISAFDTGFRNRIINGDGNIDQRNDGSSTTPASTANFIDRWKMNIFGSGRLTIGKNYGAVASPDDFISYIGMKTTTTSTPGANDYNFLSQVIEGVNTIDLQWGSANAKPITLSFWAYSSLTGTFGGSVRNAGSGGYNRSYPFTYTISSSNTWEKKTIVIPGDTTGTWTTSHLNGIEIIFVVSNGTTWQGTAFSWVAANATGPSTSLVNLIGTLNATLYLTGIQAEIGSVATPYERRNYGHEFALCQRYYQIVEVRTGGYHTTGGGLRGSAYLSTAARPISSPILTVLATDESANLGSLNANDSFFRGDSFRYIVAVTATGDAYGQWKVSCDTEF